MSALLAAPADAPMPAPVPCPSCTTPIFNAHTQSGTGIRLQEPPKGWDIRQLGGYVLEGGLAEYRSKPLPGDVLFAVHSRALCGMAGRGTAA